MTFLKKTKRDVGTVVFLGTALGVGTAVEASVAPAVPVFTQFAPVAAVAAPVIGAGIVLRSLRGLETVGQRRQMPRQPMPRRRFL